MMPNKEKVIYSIERCLCHVPDACRDCNYDNYEYNKCVEKLLLDTLELLKEQEPVKPIKPRGSASWICGACKIAIGTSLIYNFCPWCGRRVKLE